jgi:hypothetical protein
MSRLGCSRNTAKDERRRRRHKDEPGRAGAERKSEKPGGAGTRLGGISRQDSISQGRQNPSEETDDASTSGWPCKETGQGPKGGQETMPGQPMSNRASCGGVVVGSGFNDGRGRSTGRWAVPGPAEVSMVMSNPSTAGNSWAPVARQVSRWLDAETVGKVPMPLVHGEVQTPEATISALWAMDSTASLGSNSTKSHRVRRCIVHCLKNRDSWPMTGRCEAPIAVLADQMTLEPREW